MDEPHALPVETPPTTEDSRPHARRSTSKSAKLPELQIPTTTRPDAHAPATRSEGRASSSRSDAHANGSRVDSAGYGGFRAESSGPPSTDVVLRDMLDELRSIRRARQHQDFSLAHLIGSVAQAFAVCALAWALYAAMSDYKMAYVDASLRVLFAIAFQLIALTGFLASGRR